jgi:hypothetical protein
MKSKQEQAVEYIAEKQKEIGLALLILMRETNAATCNYSIELVGEGDKYEVTTVIKKLTKTPEPVYDEADVTW